MEKRVKVWINFFLIGIICLHILLSLIPVKIEPEGINKVANNGRGETYLVISPNGTLVGWGGNDYHLVGTGQLLFYPYIARKTVLRDVVSVDIGYHCAMAVDKNGTLWGWGSQTSLLLREKRLAFNRPTKVMEDVAAVGVGDSHAAAVKTDGSLWIWGEWFDKEFPEPREIMQDVKSVFVLGYTFAVRNNNDLYIFTDSDGALVCTRIATKVQAISHSGYGGYQYLMTDGKVFHFNLNFKDDNSTLSDITIDQTAIAENVRSMCFGGLIKDDDSLWVWEKENGEPVLIKQRENVAYAERSILVVTKDGKIYAETGDKGPTIPQSMRTVSPVLRNLFLLGILAKVMLNKYFNYKKNRERAA